MKAFKMIFAALLIISGFQINAQTVFTHSSNSSNTSGHITSIDNSATNGNANKLLFVTQLYSGKYNNHPFGVWYSNGKWTIYQENRVALDAGSTYNILAVDASDKAFQHKAVATNITSNWTTIDHPSCNNNPNAVLLVTQNWKGTYNPKSIGVWYNSGKWTIYNQDRSAMPVGTNFNVLVLPKGNTNISNGTASIFTANTTAKKNNYGNHLANLPLTKNSAKLFVTQNFGKSGPYNVHESAVWFDGKVWTVYNKDKAELPVNTQFNVLAIGATQTLQPDEPVAPIKAVSKEAGYVRIFNASGLIGRGRVTYEENGTLQTKSTGSLAINGSATIDIPKGVSDIKLIIETNDITSWNAFPTKEFGTNPPNTCFRIYGTAFSWSVDNDCNAKPEGGYVNFFNESGYVAKFTVTYTYNGKSLKAETGDMALGARRTINLPDGSTNIKVKGEGSAVFSWTEIFNQSFNSPPNKCFKVYATIFDPKWNNNCD